MRRPAKPAAAPKRAGTALSITYWASYNAATLSDAAAPPQRAAVEYATG